jgi:hypothetical protein
MKKVALVAAVVAVAVGTLAGTANAQSEFGQKGTLTIDAQGGEALMDPGANPGGGGGVIGLTPFIGLDFSSQSEPDRGDNIRTDSKQTTFYLNPGVDYFIIDHLSIGAEILFMTMSRSHTDHDVRARTDTKYDDPTLSGFGFMPRVGWNFPLSKSFSFWPRGGIGYRNLSNSVNDAGAARQFSDSYWFFFADAAFLWHVADHFYLGAAPGISFTLSRTWKRTDPATNVSVSADGDSLFSFRLLSAVFGGWL